ncbi:reverse transcriptase/maturase family protein [Roseovarius aestuariivivens]|uniref:reverse transcriptase/maturase family protein n=1 Tax=Roseovarius aestuariivivens TaxID=1888910 RepID=UPI00108069E5|nr:reverse transcriptase/maturase family protein [Roseovarius aestuariivivens]
MLIEQIVSDDILDEAYAWLCHRRRDYPANADIWSFRRNWDAERKRLKDDLSINSFRFEALDRVSLKDGSMVDVWTSRDALVLKAMSLCLAQVLPVSPHCTHIKSNGGAKAAIRQVAEHLPRHGFVLRTDVKSYYASIDHHLLLDRLANHIDDKAVMNLLGQYLRRSICDGGNYIDIELGISLGCPLSPLIAAFYLHELDEQFAQSNLFYVRFMDDILILAPTRWKIRKAMALVQGTLSRLHLARHPDKTFIGRIARGFDFLGYHFRDGVLSAAGKTVAKMKECIARLYEQKGRRNQPTPLGQYLTRWNGWFRGGLGGLNLRFPLLPHPQPGETGKARQDKR